MDAINRFSLEDFLSYFFPGAVGSVGVYLLLLLTPLKSRLLGLSPDLIVGALLLIWSYVFGIVLAGFFSLLHKFLPESGKVTHLRQAVLLPGMEQDVLTAFQRVFGGKLPDPWTSSHFLVCRFLVESYVPNASLLIRRQISLRRLRENLMPAVLLWGLAGLLCGGRCVALGWRGWGFGLMLLTLLLTPLVLYVLFDNLQRNNIREVREVCAALLVGVSTGAFHKLDQGAQPSSGEKPRP